MAIALNLLLPGAGLVLRRREWLGLFLALAFGICINMAIAGALIAPAAVPTWLTVLAAALGATCWLASQYLCWAQGKQLARRARTVEGLLTEASMSLSRGDHEAAGRELAAAAELEADNVETVRLQKRLDESRQAGPR